MFMSVVIGFLTKAWKEHEADTPITIYTRKMMIFLAIVYSLLTAVYIFTFCLLTKAMNRLIISDLKTERNSVLY